MITEIIEYWFKDVPNQTIEVTQGLLNRTLIVDVSKGRFIVQKLNPIFSPEVNIDIDAMTKHLQKKRLATMRLIPTLKGELWINHNGECWRVLSYIEGDTFGNLESEHHASSAGKLVGKFHRSLIDFEHDYQFSRPNAHNTREHLNKLENAMATYTKHSKSLEVAKLAQPMLDASRVLPDFSMLPRKHAHGDLKISNLVFAKREDQSSLVDFDTIGLMAWPLEMGDAFRSWCNPIGENSESVRFDADYFEAALMAYAGMASDLWSRDEVSMLIEGVRLIPLELSSRFLRDVLEDCYFEYDRKRYPDRATHNLLRAKGQFALYCDIEKKRALLERIIQRAFA